MNTAIEDDSTLTDRYQTTIPASVRRALKLKRRDRIHYMIRPNGEVVLTRGRDESSQDPVMTRFLAFLERDLQEHPENIRPVTASTFAEAERLTAGIEVDLDNDRATKDYRPNRPTSRAPCVYKSWMHTACFLGSSIH